MNNDWVLIPTEKPSLGGTGTGNSWQMILLALSVTELRSHDGESRWDVGSLHVLFNIHYFKYMSLHEPVLFGALIEIPLVVSRADNYIPCGRSFPELD